MTTALAIKTNTIGVELQFEFPHGITQQDYDKLRKKVERHRDNSKYESFVLFFSDSKTIRVILGYTVHTSTHRAYDELRAPLNRLIDSHDAVAFYSWSTTRA